MTVSKDVYNKNMDKIKKAFILLTILFFLILVGFMILLVNIRHVSHRAVVIARNNTVLLEANTKRVREDQINRINSCKHTYSGIKDVFEIFFPEPPISEQQRRDVKRFNDRIVELKRSCEKRPDN